jgi:hypothetical protein
MGEKAGMSLILMELGKKTRKRKFENDYGIERLGCVAKRLIWEIPMQ